MDGKLVSESEDILGIVLNSSLCERLGRPVIAVCWGSRCVFLYLTLLYVCFFFSFQAAALLAA